MYKFDISDTVTILYFINLKTHEFWSTTSEDIQKTDF